MTQIKQLNPFELKSALTNLLKKINSVNDIKNCLDDIEVISSQEDKSFLKKILFKELINSKIDKIPIICFLLEHFIPKNELIPELWETLKNKNLNTEVKVIVINLLRELDSDWSYQDCEDFLGDEANDILDENTKQLLNSAIINPEVQIDFMDFMSSIKVEDQITLITSFAKDFEQDALANILIPVFESAPNSAVGKEALKLLAQTKSQLALNVFERLVSMTKGELNQSIKRNLAILKMSGMRVDNTKEFYKKILSNSVPDKFYATYPDGHGDMALIFTRRTDENKIRFVSIVLNVETGIKDCFGFYEISKFECDKIIERFLKDEKAASLPSEAFVQILRDGEILTAQKTSDWELPYEYVCWKNLLVDIDYEPLSIEQILDAKLEKCDVKDDIIDKLYDMRISQHWFLNAGYSDEFENLIEELQTSDDLDEIVENNLEKIFYLSERMSWIKKLYMASFIKYSIGKISEANEIYSLTFNEKLITKLLKEILKRSIYEYLSLIKYDAQLNVFNFTFEDIERKLKYIESKWVNKNV